MDQLPSSPSAASQKVPTRSGRLGHQEGASRLGWPGTNFLGSVSDGCRAIDITASKDPPGPRLRGWGCRCRRDHHSRTRGSPSLPPRRHRGIGPRPRGRCTGTGEVSSNRSCWRIRHPPAPPRASHPIGSPSVARPGHHPGRGGRAPRTQDSRTNQGPMLSVSLSVEAWFFSMTLSWGLKIPMV